MNNLKAKAKELLESKAVQVIIGYEEGTNGAVRPAFIIDAANIDKLIFDERCKHNLALYLTKHEVKHLGKMAIVATLPVMRSIAVIMSEQQVKPEQIVVLGITVDGKYVDIPDMSAMQDYVKSCDLSNPSKDQEIIEKLNAMTTEERWAFWKAEMSKCIKCYACRQTCPMCYCIRCMVECNQPQWITSSSTTSGNFEWHLMRSQHLAGRCISCGECGRACPVGIPCHLFTMQISDMVFKDFNVRPGADVQMSSVMSTFDPNDKENFIL